MLWFIRYILGLDAKSFGSIWQLPVSAKQERKGKPGNGEWPAYFRRHMVVASGKVPVDNSVRKTNTKKQQVRTAKRAQRFTTELMGNRRFYVGFMTNTCIGMLGLLQANLDRRD